MLFVPRLSAVGDLRQELANVFYFLLGPQVRRGSTRDHHFRAGHLSCRNVACECCWMQLQPLCGNTCGKDIHSAVSVADKYERCQLENRRAENGISWHLLRWLKQNCLFGILQSGNDVLCDLCYEFLTPKWIRDLVIDHTDMAQIEGYVLLV